MRLPRFLLLLLLILPGSPVQAQRALDEATYRDCLALVRSNPDEAFAFAQTWVDTGGGLIAKHCAALALFERRHYTDAGERLEALLPDAERQAPHLLPEILGQAANAWLLAGVPRHARELLGIALKAWPDNIDLLLDRAQVQAELNDYAAARADLDRVLALDPTRDEALALRAAARRQLGDAAGALEDAETALVINARSPEALLERGLLRAAANDRRGARADLIQVRLLAPDTPAAEAAGSAIEKLDLKTD